METPKPASSIKQKRRWYSASALSAAAFVDSSEDWTLSILWPYVYKSLMVSVDRLGPVLGISGLIRTLTLPFWGAIADRVSRKGLLVFMTGIWGLWTLAIAYVQDLNQLFMVRILSSLGLAVLWPTAFSLLSDLFDSTERGRAAGLMTAVSYAGNLVGFAVLPALAATSPEAWRTGFLVMGVASALSGVLLFFINDPPRGASEPELKDVIDETNAQRFAFNIREVPVLLKIGTWRFLMLQNAVDHIALAVLYGWVFTWFDEIGLSDSAFIAMLILSLGNLLGHAFFGWLGDKLEDRSPEHGRAWLGMIGLAVSVPSLAGFILLGPKGFVSLVVFGMLTGLSLSSIGTGAQWPMAQGVLRPELRATGRAAMDMVVGIVGSLSMTFSGLLVSRFDVSTMLLILVPLPKLLSAIAWIPLFRSYPYDRKQLHGEMQERRDTLLSGQ